MIKLTSWCDASVTSTAYICWCTRRYISAMLIWAMTLKLCSACGSGVEMMIAVMSSGSSKRSESWSLYVQLYLGQTSNRWRLSSRRVVQTSQNGSERKRISVGRGFRSIQRTPNNILVIRPWYPSGEGIYSCKSQLVVGLESDGLKQLVGLCDELIDELFYYKQTQGYYQMQIVHLHVVSSPSFIQLFIYNIECRLADA